VSLYRDEGVVLRAQKLGEADRIVTLLTREHGRVRAVAKGVRKTSSRLGARVEPFMLVDVQLYEGRSLDIVTQAETIGPYGTAIASDYGRYTAGTAMLETAERLTETEREPALQLFLLLAGGLRTLALGEHAPGLVLDAYLLRSLSVAGWAPNFIDCAKCGAPGPHEAFNVPAGGCVCPVCRPAGSASPHPQTLDLLAEHASAECRLGVCREDLEGLAAHAERSSREDRVVARVLDRDVLAQERFAVDLPPRRRICMFISYVSGDPRP